MARTSHQLKGIYTALVTLLLAWLGIEKQFAGPFLWPAAGVHALLTVLLSRSMRGGR